MAKKALFKVPKSLPVCADTLYSTKQERLLINKDANGLEEREKQIKEYLKSELERMNSAGISGKQAKVSLEPDWVPVVEDWDRFYAFIYKNKAAHVYLSKSINTSAIKELLTSLDTKTKKGTLPGINRLNIKKISCTKIAGK